MTKVLLPKGAVCQRSLAVHFESGAHPSAERMHDSLPPLMDPPPRFPARADRSHPLPPAEYRKLASAGNLPQACQAELTALIARAEVKGGVLTSQQARRTPA